MSHYQKQMSHSPCSMVPLNDAPANNSPSRKSGNHFNASMSTVGIHRQVFMEGKNDTNKRSRFDHSSHNFSSSSGGSKGSNGTLSTEFASSSSSSSEYSHSVCSSDDGEEDLDFFQYNNSTTKLKPSDASFSRVLSSPNLASLVVRNDHERNKICDEQPLLNLCESDFESATHSRVKRAKCFGPGLSIPAGATSTTTASQIMSMFSRVQSMPDLTNMTATSTAKMAEPNTQAKGNTMTSVGELSASPYSRDSSLEDTNPQDLLHTILKSHGFACGSIGTDCFKFASLEHKDFFLAVTEEQVAGYNNELTTAVRCEDIAALREMRRMGKTLQCSNKFGESIVHMACRKGSTKLLQFLLDEANVSLRVSDDFGRTPLHDACWSREPDFSLMSLLLSRDPDLLLLADKRGHTPLGYVRRDHWGQWSQFLNEHRDMLIPRELIKRNS